MSERESDGVQYRHATRPYPSVRAAKRAVYRQCVDGETLRPSQPMRGISGRTAKRLQRACSEAQSGAGEDAKQDSIYGGCKNPISLSKSPNDAEHQRKSTTSTAVMYHIRWTASSTFRHTLNYYAKERHPSSNPNSPEPIYIRRRACTNTLTLGSNLISRFGAFCIANSKVIERNSCARSVLGFLLLEAAISRLSWLGTRRGDSRSPTRSSPSQAEIGDTAMADRPLRILHDRFSTQLRQ